MEGRDNRREDERSHTFGTDDSAESVQACRWDAKIIFVVAIRHRASTEKRRLTDCPTFGRPFVT
eukprot:1735526-Prymnesium_polylepis.3